MRRMSRKRFSCGHIAAFINCGIHIGSEAGCIRSCPTNATAGWQGLRKHVGAKVLLEDAADDDLRVEPAHTVPTEGWRVDLEQAIAVLPDENRVAVLMFYVRAVH